jgi:hypothetical protein
MDFTFIYVQFCLYNETCMNWTLKKVPMKEIFVNWFGVNWTPVYSEHKIWSKEVRFRQVSLYIDKIVCHYVHNFIMLLNNLISWIFIFLDGLWKTHLLVLNSWMLEFIKTNKILSKDLEIMLLLFECASYWKENILKFMNL